MATGVSNLLVTSRIEMCGFVCSRAVKVSSPILHDEAIGRKSRSTAQCGARPSSAQPLNGGETCFRGPSWRFLPAVGFPILTSTVMLACSGALFLVLLVYRTAGFPYFLAYEPSYALIHVLTQSSEHRKVTRAGELDCSPTPCSYLSSDIEWCSGN